MTQQEWFAAATNRLTVAGCEDAAFDAQCLLEDIGGLVRGHRPGDKPLEPTAVARLDEALAQREAGRPLQYILGEWEFLRLTLSVGEGVLIPRADTECLCIEAARRLMGMDAPRALDLCAGSGCVGLGIASIYPDVQVTAVELSPEALPYLRENVARYPNLSVAVVQADVLTDAAQFADGWDLLVSNPPYIPTEDLPGLQREVQHEPALALDGAADGLRFYRAIAEQWIPKLRTGGVCAVEVGIGQAADVAALFEAAGLTDIRRIRDYGGVERVVSGVKK